MADAQDNEYRKLSGMAMRLCIELGYHRSVSRYRRHANPLVAEISKRCFWVAYDIDRMISFYLGRPIGISDDWIDVELPLDLDDQCISATRISHEMKTTPTTMITGALHMIKLRKIWTVISTTVYSPVQQSSDTTLHPKRLRTESISQEIDQWYRSSPIYPPCPSLNPMSVYATSDWFWLANAHTVLILYRYWLVHDPASTDDPFIDRAFCICQTTSQQMCFKYRKLFRTPNLQFTWNLVHVLFLAGITYIYCIWKSPKLRRETRHIDVVNTCVACHTVLVIVAERWPHAAGIRSIFEFLWEKTIELVYGEEGARRPLQAGQEREEGDVQPHMMQDWLIGLEDTAFSQDSDHLLLELLGEVGDGAWDPHMFQVGGTTPFDEGVMVQNGQFEP
ncbi:unnamed protein product [Clonostachys rhizophaga]|uniref:Xylanolytic transcriptional activator regulatory domain-containing protein n=1 Tax=Clonostachys rhizophaga TaxID=160324 RepID=A0A9N9VEX7_9HYPO|nr:unnamed protein product [Clonostachys rhizophaga]